MEGRRERGAVGKHDGGIERGEPENAAVALHASRDGRSLYEGMGYIPWPTPMMFLPIVRYNSSA